MDFLVSAIGLSQRGQLLRLTVVSVLGVRIDITLSNTNIIPLFRRMRCVSKGAIQATYGWIIGVVLLGGGKMSDYIKSHSVPSQQGLAQSLKYTILKSYLYTGNPDRSDVY